jgi:hypothetical protein
VLAAIKLGYQGVALARRRAAAWVCLGDQVAGGVAADRYRNAVVERGSPRTAQGAHARCARPPTVEPRTPRTPL